MKQLPFHLQIKYATLPYSCSFRLPQTRQFSPPPAVTKSFEKYICTVNNVALNKDNFCKGYLILFPDCVISIRNTVVIVVVIDNKNCDFVSTNSTTRRQCSLYPYLFQYPAGIRTSILSSLPPFSSKYILLL